MTELGRGTVLASRYQLLEPIGQGGMGRVWRATDVILDRSMAIKEILVSENTSPEQLQVQRERALREARATARIDHPNVVRVYDVLETDERLWIVMELVTGLSLERVLLETGPLQPAAVVFIGQKLVDALRTTHAMGVLHRDIKPGNVLLDSSPAGRIVLTDFGIAAIQDSTALTMAGMLVGSPDYMAPERIEGRSQGPPSDLWSLGATLYAALAGRSPFSRDTTLATLHAVLYEEPDLSFAGPLLPLLTKLLAKDPGRRPSVDELTPSLHQLAGTAPTTGRHPKHDHGGVASGERTWPWQRDETDHPAGGATENERLDPAARPNTAVTAPRAASSPGPPPEPPVLPDETKPTKPGYQHPGASSASTVTPPPPPNQPLIAHPAPDPSSPRSYIPRKPMTAFVRQRRTSQAPDLSLNDPSHEPPRT